MSDCEAGCTAHEPCVGFSYYANLLNYCHLITTTYSCPTGYYLSIKSTTAATSNDLEAHRISVYGVCYGKNLGNNNLLWFSNSMLQLIKIELKVPYEKFDNLRFLFSTSLSPINDVPPFSSNSISWTIDFSLTTNLASEKTQISSTIPEGRKPLMAKPIEHHTKGKITTKNIAEVKSQFGSYDLRKSSSEYI